MSRQSKGARNKELAARMSAIRKGGGRSPARTTPKHDKVHVMWSDPDVRKSRLEIIARSNEARRGLPG